MALQFYKYAICGQGYVIIDNTSGAYTKTIKENYPDILKQLCHKVFGISVDCALEVCTFNDNMDKTVNSQALKYEDRNVNRPMFDLKCYSGYKGRFEEFTAYAGLCATHFAKIMKYMPIDQDGTRFNTSDGIHYAICNKNDTVQVTLYEPLQLRLDTDSSFYVNTGQRHHVSFVSEIDDLDVVHEGRAINQWPEYTNLSLKRKMSERKHNFPEGVIVVFVSNKASENINSDKKNGYTIKIRSYHPHKDEELASSDSGALAAALCTSVRRDYFTKSKETEAEKEIKALKWQQALLEQLITDKEKQSFERQTPPRSRSTSQDYPPWSLLNQDKKCQNRFFNDKDKNLKPISSPPNKSGDFQDVTKTCEEVLVVQKGGEQKIDFLKIDNGGKYPQFTGITMTAIPQLILAGTHYALKI